MKRLCLVLLCLVSIIFTQGCSTVKTTPTLTFLGRSTIMLTASDGSVAYVDPFAPGDYSAKASLVLVSHGHEDHNNVGLVTLADKASIASPSGAVSVPGSKVIKEGDDFTVGKFRVRVVPAYNSNHPRAENVGFVITFDNISVYHSGDTSYIPEMANLKDMNIDYALFCADGYWNMGGVEAAKCADAVQSKFAMAMHTSPDDVYNEENAKLFVWKSTLDLKVGTVLKLETARK